MRSLAMAVQVSSAIAVLARALHLHFCSLRHGDYRSCVDKPGQITDRRRNRWFGVIIFQNALSPYQRVWPSFLYSTASIL